jgi:hypothetical protein
MARRERQRTGHPAAKLNFAAGFRGLKSFLCNLFGPFRHLTDVGVFTFVLAVVALLQWQTLEKTDRTFKAQQRAWIAPHHPVLETGMHRGREFKYAIFYGNVGKEPAINMVIQQEEDAIVFFKDTSWEGIFARNNVRRFDCAGSHPNEGGIGVFPTNSPERTYEVDTGKLIPDEADVYSEAKILLVKGCFGYNTLSEPHYSWFCYFWPKISEPNLWRLCPRGTNAAN